MGSIVATAAVLFSVLIPGKGWYTPDQPLQVTVKAPGPVTLMMTDFLGAGIDSKDKTPQSPIHVAGEKTVNINELFPAATNLPGCYLLYAVPEGRTNVSDFIGTPLVIMVMDDKRIGAPPGPMVIRVEPLRYAQINTDQGVVTVAFFYDVAPHTSDNFLELAQNGFYDGLTFHRTYADFIIQGGDPRGDGTGGPGYQVDAEFSDRKHKPGVLSMARRFDPNEAPMVKPRPEYANSAGSQFFICIDYGHTRALDGVYTAFGSVVEGMDVVKKIAAAPLADPATGKPQHPCTMRKVEVKTVEPGHNPYAALQELLKPTAAGGSN